jgi:hypothetical protein
VNVRLSLCYEHERYWVSVNYFSSVTGELEKANETCQHNFMLTGTYRGFVC